MPDSHSFWTSPWTITIGGGAVVALLGWAGKELFDRRRPTPPARILNPSGGTSVAGDIRQTGQVNVVASGGGVTVNASPDAHELARAQQRVERERALEVKEVMTNLDAVVATTRTDLRALVSDISPSNIDGRIESALDEWETLRPKLGVLGDHGRTESYEHFFGDIAYEFQTMREAGGPTFAKILGLIHDADSILGVAARPWGSLRFPYFGLEWDLTRQFWLSYGTTMADEAAPSFIRSMVQGPYCLNCKHDMIAAIEIGIEGPMKCGECGAAPDSEALEGRFGYPIESSEVVRVAVYSKAQALARAGRLLPPEC